MEEAIERVDSLLGAEIDRLRQLQRLGHPVRESEIAIAEKEMGALQRHIENARVKMDAVRVVLVGS